MYRWYFSHNILVIAESLYHDVVIIAPFDLYPYCTWWVVAVEVWLVLMAFSSFRGDSRKSVCVSWSGLKVWLCAATRAASLTQTNKRTSLQVCAHNPVFTTVTLRGSRCICVQVFLFWCVFVWTVSSPGLKTFNPCRSSSAQKLMGTTR